eukprot:gene535-1023_t
MSDLNNLLPIIRSEFGKLKIPTQHDKVYKDECIFSFDSPFSDSGLYVNICTFQGFGADFLDMDISRTQSKLYLHQKWSQIPKPAEDTDNVAPTKLAIGTEGGFQGESKFDIIKENSLVVVTSTGLQQVSLPNTDLPEFVSNICQAIIDHNGMKSKMQVDSWEANEEKIISKYAETLIQLNNGKKISNDPSTWSCEASGDKHNLWLNLSTGYIGGGRKNWDGTGGSGAALNYFIETGKKYPLCVKLGTITPHGADVWSYADDEDCMVIDPLLADHLTHWGIDIMKLEKTDKTLAELEVEMNQTYQWTKILEEGQELLPLSGPGYVGLHNIGSSCYMNSVLQTILSFPEVQERYFNGHQDIITTAPSDPASDVITQLAKVAHAILSNKYIPPLKSNNNDNNKKHESSILEKYVIAPRMFKHVVGKGHKEFSSSKQQDASEYFQYLLQILERAEKSNLGRLGGVKPGSYETANIFKFELEQRIQCQDTGEVKYISGSKNIQNILELRIPLEQMVYASTQSPELKKQRVEEDKNNDSKDNDSKDNDNDISKPEVPFAAFIKLGRYYVDSNWIPRKVDAIVAVPDTLDLRHLRAQGLQSGEIPMSESTATGGIGIGGGVSVTPDTTVVVDEMLVLQLMEMGFSENGCRRAALATNNAPAEVAMGWIFEHMEDPDFNDPPQTSTSMDVTHDVGTIDPEVVAMLASSLGYSESHVRRALRETDNDVERAADWIFSHPEDGNGDNDTMDVVSAPAQSSSTSGTNANVTSTSTSNSTSSCEDGDGVYSMVAVISHMGRNTEHGHYVCHVRKEGEWVLFNDEKVARSRSVPSELGFMYFFRRNDASGTL